MNDNASILRSYPTPAGAALSDLYAVKVRRPGGNWQQLAIYDVRVDLHTLSHAAFAYFDCAGPIEIEVTAKSPVTSVAVRPRSCGIAATLRGQTASFTIGRPMNLSIEFDGDTLHNLHLFASAPEVDVPSPGDAQIIYFGPGLHTLGSHPAITSEGSVGGQSIAVIKVSSGQTVYLAGGSIVQAAIQLVDHAQKVTIRGRGILDLSPWNEPKGHYVKGHTWQTGAISLPFASEVRVEGIIIKQPTGYSISAGKADGVTIQGVKSFSCHEWSDGLDLMASSNVHISDVFLRNSDDCIAAYGSRWKYRGDSRNWVVENSSFWADKAHAIYLGVHGDFENQGDTLENMVFRNIDILENDETDDAYWGAISIGCGDRNVCRKITFDDIRVEHIRNSGGRLIDLQFKYFPPSTVTGRSIEDIVFRKISYDGPHESLLEGKSPEQAIRGVRFENVMINGKHVLRPEDGAIRIGNFVADVEFK